MLRRILAALRPKSPPPAPPPATMRHPRLGEIEYDPIDDRGGLWRGRHADGGVEFTVGGDAQGPDPILAERLAERLDDLPDLERRTRAFLRSEYERSPDLRRDLRSFETGPDGFRMESVDFLWPELPDSFMVCLRLEGDDDGAWRVDFEGGEPRFLARDD